ncbi:MAG: ATP-binding cassette domain-containing protein, partial [Acidobacteria bacterium]|nr:ATP-binding cassette domain-containing protein [Acidobacteriota bacterium]
GLKGSAAHQTPDTLSGGERAKLALSMLAASEANLLILDEPTNNLDPASVVAVGEMLRGWSGTIIAVSHERAFVEALEPTHAVLLPEEFFDLWRDDYLDLVEQR